MLHRNNREVLYCIYKNECNTNLSLSIKIIEREEESTK